MVWGVNGAYKVELSDDLQPRRREEALGCSPPRGSSHSDEQAGYRGRGRLLEPRWLLPSMFFSQAISLRKLQTVWCQRSGSGQMLRSVKATCHARGEGASSEACAWRRLLRPCLSTHLEDEVAVLENVRPREEVEGDELRGAALDLPRRIVNRSSLSPSRCVCVLDVCSSRRIPPCLR